MDDYDWTEHCFVRDHEPNLTTTDEGLMFGEDVALEGLAWASQYSGTSYNIFKSKVVPYLLGEATIRVVWEDGDAEYYEIKNGKMEAVDLEALL